MRAAVYTKYGSPDVLTVKNLDKPIPKDNEVLIRVHACTVNRTDCATVRAIPFFMRLVTGFLKPKKTIPGTDFSGEIEAVGKLVTSYKVGDKVYGFDDGGLSSHADYIVLAEDQTFIIIPENTTYAQATASCEGAHYAINFINKVKIKAGQKILVNGATGAIGSALVQLLKFHEVEVVAVCGTENVDLVKSLGADRVIDFLKKDFTTEAFDQEQDKYDHVFDAVGKSSFGQCKPLIKLGGSYISSELGWMWQNLFYALYTPIVGSRTVKFPYPADIMGSLTFIKQLIEQGRFKAVIDKVYPLEQIVDTYNYVESGQKIGNVVISMES